MLTNFTGLEEKIAKFENVVLQQHATIRDKGSRKKMSLRPYPLPLSLMAVGIFPPLIDGTSSPPSS